MSKKQKEHVGGCKFDFIDREKLVCIMNTNHWIVVADDRRRAVLLELLQLDRLTGKAKKEVAVQCSQECLLDEQVELNKSSIKFVQIDVIDKEDNYENYELEEWDF